MKKSICLLLFIITLFGLAVTVYAESNSVSDTAGNTVVVQDSNNAPCTTDGTEYKKDLYWFGSNLNASNLTIGNDAILAGKNIFLNNSKIAGDLRAAMYEMNLSGAEISQNITAAGYSITIGEGTKAAGIFLAGKDISFSGESNGLMIAAENATINGTVHGDVNVMASNVTIGANTVIDGVLNIESNSHPTIPEGASIGSVSYKMSPSSEKESEESENNKKTAENGFLNKMKSCGYWLIACALLSLLFCLIIPNTLDQAGKYLSSRPIPVFVSGLIAILAVPVLVIVLLITSIGAPLGGLFGILFAIVCFFATPFAASAAGRIVFPKLNKLLASLIGTAILTELEQIPYLGSVLKFAVILFTLGYFIQTVWLNNKKKEDTAGINVSKSIPVVSGSIENKQ